MSGTGDVSELSQAKDSREELLREASEALAALVADWDAGGTQTPRTEDCGDSECGYASCRLARALATEQS